MKTDLNYSAGDCFETFPFPHPEPRTVVPALELIGERLYSTCAKYTLDTSRGLTKTYNELTDPACIEPPILALRELHEVMDRAVLDAYGWLDLIVPPFCPTTQAEEGAYEQFKHSIIDRPFVLNAERAAEEARLGIGQTARAKPERARAPTAHDVSAAEPAKKTAKPKQKRLFEPEPNS